MVSYHPLHFVHGIMVFPSWNAWPLYLHKVYQLRFQQEAEFIPHFFFFKCRDYNKEADVLVGLRKQSRKVRNLERSSRVKPLLPLRPQELGLGAGPGTRATPWELQPRRPQSSSVCKALVPKQGRHRRKNTSTVPPPA